MLFKLTVVFTVDTVVLSSLRDCFLLLPLGRAAPLWGSMMPVETETPTLQSTEVLGLEAQPPGHHWAGGKWSPPAHFMVQTHEFSIRDSPWGTQHHVKAFASLCLFF